MSVEKTFLISKLVTLLRYIIVLSDLWHVNTPVRIFGSKHYLYIFEFIFLKISQFKDQNQNKLCFFDNFARKKVLFVK